MWLTRISTIATTVAGSTKGRLLTISKVAMVGGLATAGVAAIPLAYDAYTAGPAPTMAQVWAQRRAYGVAEAAEEETSTTVPSVTPSALRVQLAGGGSEVTRADLQRAGGQLALEVVGIDSVTDPIGVWTVCVGVPRDALQVAAMPAGWQGYERRHDHAAGIAIGQIIDRDRGPYETYIFELPVNERPRGPVPLETSLRIRPLMSGVHRIGLGVTKATNCQGRQEFLKHKSTLYINCSP
jgi:hypothetical protein